VLEVSATATGIEHHVLVSSAQAGLVLAALRAALPSVGVRRLTEYQFAGDCEGHAIPTKP
jgi:hypothetical protein